MRGSLSITVIGSGYVGLVVAVCFAEIGHQVFCVDKDEARILALRQGISPIHEEFLPDLLRKPRPNPIEFTTDLHSATLRAEAVFIAVGTPRNCTGGADLSFVDAVAGEIARSIDSYKVVVEKSTVPVCTSDWIRQVLESKGVAGNLFDVASNPEFLREGSAVVDFLHADRVLFGAEASRAAEILRQIYLPLTTGSYYRRTDAVPGPRSEASPPALLHTSARAAEIIKQASNAFLATKISFINAIAHLCDATGVDVEQVACGIGADHRIGRDFLHAGIGYGGPCFAKDIAAFRSVAEQLGVDFGLLREVEEINAAQKARFLHKVRSALGTLPGRHIGVLGLAYKAGTDDIRESPAVALIRQLQDEGCAVAAHDPAAMERSKEVLPPGPRMSYAGNPYAAAHDADALLVLSDWPEFAELELPRLYGTLRRPIVIDGRNLFDPAVMAEHGFTYLSVGRPTAAPREALAGLSRP